MSFIASSKKYEVPGEWQLVSTVHTIIIYWVVQIFFYDAIDGGIGIAERV
jgi:hypothetical protein